MKRILLVSMLAAFPTGMLLGMLFTDHTSHVFMGAAFVATMIALWAEYMGGER